MLFHSFKIKYDMISIRKISAIMIGIFKIKLVIPLSKTGTKFCSCLSTPNVDNRSALNLSAWLRSEHTFESALVHPKPNNAPFAILLDNEL
jgi:hypothetical protein